MLTEEQKDLALDIKDELGEIVALEFIPGVAINEEKLKEHLRSLKFKLGELGLCEAMR